MAALTKVWLQVVPWETVVSINQALCDARHSLHKPTSDGYGATKALWERSRSKELSLTELLELFYQCHRLAPFCNYNGNTFVAVLRTLLTDELKQLSPDQAHVLRSIAGHIVAGTATEIERRQLDRMLAKFGK